jgi:hypothetical protein
MGSWVATNAIAASDIAAFPRRSRAIGHVERGRGVVDLVERLVGDRELIGADFGFLSGRVLEQPELEGQLVEAGGRGEA